AVALLRLLQIVGGHQDRSAGVGEAVDHPPEGAPRERIDAGGGLVQEQHGGLVHDRRAERDTLLPSSGQASRDLVFSSLEARERQDPGNLLLALAVGNPVDAGEELEVLANRQVVVEGKLLRHVAEALSDVLGVKIAALAGQPHLAATGVEKA